MKEKDIKYNSINGLKSIAAIGIIIMHVAANTKYAINSMVYNDIIPEMASFVFLFMLLSGFGMCCGYYNKIKNKEITMNDFYKKRYAKIFPFFFILIVIDVLIERNISALYEGIADMTLAFSFLPNSDISIIGVGWTLGVIFAFYMLFPFFVFLIDNKKRAWFTFIITIILNIICVNYFFTDKFVLPSFSFKHNILYCFVFFVAGGLIYLYKDNISKKGSKYKYLYLIISILLTILFFAFFRDFKYRTLYVCLLFSTYLIFAISYDWKLLNNKITTFLNSISFEIYLCHMFIFRIVEKLNLLYISNNPIISFIISCIMTIGGSILFAVIVKKGMKFSKEKLLKFREKELLAKTK